jgi:hypothetical protein
LRRQKRNFHQQQGVFTNSLESLGLNNLFPNNQGGGYDFVIEADDLSFVAHGKPAAPGITGNTDCHVNNLNYLWCSPNPDADAEENECSLTFTHVLLR